MLRIMHFSNRHHRLKSEQPQTLAPNLQSQCGQTMWSTGHCLANKVSIFVKHFGILLGHASWNIVSYFEVDICIVYISVLTFHERAMSSGSFNSDRFQTRPQWGHPSDYCGEFCGLFCIFSFPHNKHTHTDLHTISRTNICIQFLPLSHLHVMILLQGGAGCYNDPHSAKGRGLPSPCSPILT